MEPLVVPLDNEKLIVGCAESSFLLPENNLRIIVRECAALSSATEIRTLNKDEIHLWHAEVSDEFTQHRLLSEDEIARMLRFHFEKDRQNFIFCRSMLRVLLASYLGNSPAELCFAYSAQGKPALAFPSSGLEFNLSHSNGNFLAAITSSRKIGADIEFDESWNPFVTSNATASAITTTSATTPPPLTRAVCLTPCLGGYVVA